MVLSGDQLAFASFLGVDLECEALVEWIDVDGAGTELVFTAIRSALPLPGPRVTPIPT